MLTALLFLIEVYSVMIILRVLASWLPMGGGHPVIRFLEDVTDPLLDPIRRVIPPLAGLDFAPMILIILLTILGNTLPSLLS